MVRLGRRPADDGTDRYQAYPDGIPSRGASRRSSVSKQRMVSWTSAAPQPGGEVAAGRKRGRPRCGVPGRTCEDAGQAGGEIGADRVSSESRQWLAQCGLTVERLAAQIEPVYLPERKIHLYHCDHRGLPLTLISTEGHGLGEERGV